MGIGDRGEEEERVVPQVVVRPDRRPAALAGGAVGAAAAEARRHHHHEVGVDAEALDEILLGVLGERHDAARRPHRSRDDEAVEEPLGRSEVLGKDERLEVVDGEHARGRPPRRQDAAHVVHQLDAEVAAAQGQPRRLGADADRLAGPGHRCDLGGEGVDQLGVHLGERRVDEQRELEVRRVLGRDRAQQAGRVLLAAADDAGDQPHDVEADPSGRSPGARTHGWRHRHRREVGRSATSIACSYACTRPSAVRRHVKTSAARAAGPRDRGAPRPPGRPGARRWRRRWRRRRGGRR